MGVAHGQHQPISGGVEHEADLVGERERQLVRSEASCVLCSLIRFSAWPRAQYRPVVDPLGRADIEAGDDEADVEAEHRRLNIGDGTPFAIPGLCFVAGLGISRAETGRLSMARRVRMSSATSSTFLARGLVPDRPKM